MVTALSENPAGPNLVEDSLRLPVSLDFFRHSLDTDSIAITVCVGDDYRVLGANGYPPMVSKLFSDIRFYQMFATRARCESLNVDFIPNWDNLGWSTTQIAESIMSPAGFHNGCTLPILDEQQIQVIGFVHTNVRATKLPESLPERFTQFRDSVAEMIRLLQARENTKLTRRETAVLRLIEDGKTTIEIGEILFISPRTVDTHIENILRKTGTKNRAHAAAWGVLHHV